MKPAIAVFIAFFSALPFMSFSQVISDLTEQKLAGKVKSLTEYTFKVKKVHGKIQKEYTGKTRCVYNQHGNKYNDYTYNPDGSLESSTVFNYNKDGLLEQEDGYNGDGSPGYTNIYKYDISGNLVSIKLFNGAGSLFFKTVCEYDLEDNEVAETNYTLAMEREKLRDAVLNKTSWQYDKRGNTTKEIYVEGDSATVRVTSFSYDNNGNLSERIKSENGFALRTTYQYDGSGNKTEEVEYDVKGIYFSKVTSRYDEKGNDIEDTYFDKDGNQQTHSVFVITYDKQGNWIRKEQTVNNKPVLIIDREIEYY